MSEPEEKYLDNRGENLPMGGRSADPVSKWTPARSDVINAYRVAEFVTLARDGSPVCWPLAPDVEGGRLVFSTGYVYPTKARNIQHNPRVAVLFSDPTASGRSDADPFVLVQGQATVFDQDLQRNTERYVDQLLLKGPILFRMMVRTPGLRQLMVGYLARIWIEVTPYQEYVWARADPPPEPLRTARRPASFTPGPGIELPRELFDWLPRYTRPPVLSYIDATGWPALTRIGATVGREHIALGSEMAAAEGAPACLTFHRLIGDYWANDGFLIRGHFDADGRLIPERVVGFSGTRDDRGMGSMKVIRMLLGFRRQLSLRMEKEARALPIVRPTRRA